jgi:hypothetical protein
LRRCRVHEKKLVVVRARIAWFSTVAGLEGGARQALAGGSARQ